MTSGREDRARGDVTIEATGISKAFGPVQALQDVSLVLHPGEVHTIAGENGSGKSTLLKILGGVIRADSGDIAIDGKPHDFTNVRSAMRAGVTIVSQELSLVPALSVAENVFLGHHQVRNTLGINWRQTQAECELLLEKLSLDIDTSLPVGSLAQDKQQLIEIARALAFDSRVILLDEPTSSLEPSEVAALFNVMRQLKSDGVALVFISHRMREMLDISDRFTVLRDGQFIDSAAAAQVDAEWLIQRMVLQHSEPFTGDDVGAGTKAQGKPSQMEVVSLSDRAGRVDDVSISFKSGEITGIAGLAGAGRTELAECIMGYHPRASGQVVLDDRSVGSSTKSAVQAGISLVPDDRRGKSALLDMSVRDNLLLSDRGSWWTRRSASRERRTVEAWIKKFQIKAPDLSAPLRTLSGGNQQKVIIARCLQSQPRVLILDEPTRGIDLGAKEEIYAILRQLANAGLIVLAVSSELDEIMYISDRVVVMHAGRVTGDMPRSNATEQRIIEAATGQDEIDNREAGSTR